MFEGSLVALATPFDRNNRIDFVALERLIDYHVDQGSDGLVIAGTTGESATLEQAEHVELIRRAADLAGGRLPVIAGTGSNSTRQTIDLSLAVADCAIDAYLLVVPYYNKPVQEGLYRHFAAIADAVSKPVMLYNVPGRTVADLLPETLGRLAGHPNIFGIKDATGSMQRLEQNRAATPSDFRHYSGDDFTTLSFLKGGGHGVVTVSGNVAPALMAGMCRAVREGRVADAEANDALLQPLNTALFLESNPIPVKWALQEMGLIGEGIRLPLTVYDEQFHGQMRDAMANAGISAGKAA
ncbi:MAG: 4-hydroxy-tetrahydrodipicolinate synthase [Gammaproteobacteria bacterium]|nr:4-hydroxy-tetrahydrodipicolinate synthase [Gammaproteobacteria bacterium]